MPRRSRSASSGWGSSLRSRRVVVLVAVAAFALGNLAVTLLRSTIPIALNGPVTHLETRAEKHPGVDDVHLLTVGGRKLQIDAAVADRLRVGDVIDKRGWSRTLHTPRGDVRLEPSADVWGMAVAMPIVCAVSTILAVRRRLRQRRRSTGEALSARTTG
jgi:hypothetical protein